MTSINQSFNKQTHVLVPVTRMEPMELINIPYNEWPESIRATAHAISTKPSFMEDIKKKSASDPMNAKKYLIEAINKYNSDIETIQREFGL